MAENKYKTEQENFWAGQFGKNYIKRNNSTKLLSSNIELFRRVLSKVPNVGSVLELGCNIGMNLHAIHSLHPNIAIDGVEINETAIELAMKNSNFHIYNQSIIEPIKSTKSYDLVFSKTVLIHICPDHLQSVYKNLVKLSNRYVMVAEYYNPNPVSIEYRGHNEKLFKRDFAGELIDNFNLKLIDYGFVYHRDRHPQDDISWFLMEKSG
ncbi:methyltransferase domain-containing protein [Alphaproteobacteria bacterium]|nr:methyltransferase domain-containing protein [Alphaproteobacteria bacterium]